MLYHTTGDTPRTLSEAELRFWTSRNSGSGKLVNRLALADCGRMTSHPEVGLFGVNLT